MNFPPFWARGLRGDFSCWRWSAKSLAEAQALADQAVEQLADRFKHGDIPAKGRRYYPDRPFREQRRKVFRVPLIVEDRTFQRGLHLGKNTRRDSGGKVTEKQGFHSLP